MRFVPGLLLVLFAACKDAVGPPPPPPPPAIVNLIMAKDTGFWRGGALRLSSLVLGAVTDHGDTVAAPAVSWTLPAGFTRQGDSVLATKEARGALRASLSGAVLDSTVAASMDDLSAGGKKWSGGYRCYGGTWDATRTTDTVVYWFTAGTVSYTEVPWSKGTYQAAFRFDSVSTIAYLSDGTVDTSISVPNNGERHYFQQDTMSLRLIASADTIPMSKDQLVSSKYSASAPICTVARGWQRDGTAWELLAP